jgi:hypothetical protein
MTVVVLTASLLAASPAGWFAEVAEQTDVGITAVTASPRMAGDLYFQPLMDDGQTPYGLLAFHEHPDTLHVAAGWAEMGNAGTGLAASVDGTVFWQNTGLHLGAGVTHDLTPYQVVLVSNPTGPDSPAVPVVDPSPLRDASFTASTPDLVLNRAGGTTATWEAGLTHYLTERIRVSVSYVGGWDSAPEAWARYEGVRASAAARIGPALVEVEGDAGSQSALGAGTRVTLFLGRRWSVGAYTQIASATYYGFDQQGIAGGLDARAFIRAWLSVELGYRRNAYSVTAGSLYSQVGNDIPLANIARSFASDSVSAALTARF